jgi:hypothetical protein
MSRFIHRTLLPLLATLVLASVFVAGALQAEKRTEIAGKLTAELMQNDSLTAADAPDHELYLQASAGTNASTGDVAFLDGATIQNTGFADITHGNGTHEGYIKFTTDGGNVYANWAGGVTTTLSSDGKPSTTFEGTFSFSGGTGQYEKIRGNGQYTGMYTSAKTYAIEWTGKYSIEK